MKYITQKLFFILILLIASQSYASHIVGGDVTVRYLSSNASNTSSTFRITMQFFRDCSTTVPFDEYIYLGIFSNNSTFSYQATVNLKDSSKVTLGDACYDPKMCMMKGTYEYTVTLSNNSSGYYISTHRCCRNIGIANIKAPSDYAGYIMYCEIPNPSLHNSTPVFNKTPDGYMCLNYPNSDDFSCTDIDGDSLVYSFIDPLSCSSIVAGGPVICSSNTTQINNPQLNTIIPGAQPKPYGIINWQSPYNVNNAMGDVNQKITPAGIVTTTPPNAGVFVFCVKVEEYRNGVKLGEIRRDFQFKTLPCWNLYASFNPSPNICAGKSTTLTAIGPPSGYTYSWAPGGQTTPSIVVAPTASGTYNYTVTATNGSCTSKAVAVVIVNPNPTSSAITANNILCNGGFGTATVNANGGASPYSYVWQTAPVQTTQTATNLTPGTYSVIITDANRCSSTKTVSITQPAAPLSNTITGTTTGCNISTGTASVNVAGGTPAYTYLWNSTPLQTTAQATGLPSGTYSVLVTDNNGCTKNSSVYVPVANGPTVTATVLSNVSCFGTNTGSASTSATVGGTNPYQYLWSPSSQTTADATGLYAQTYTVLVTDANNCSSFSMITITEPTKLTTSSGMSATNVSCYLGSNGSATVTPTGGTPGYSYVWSTLPAQTTAVVVGLSANTIYSVTVTDALGCTSTSSITLTHPSQLVSSISTSNMPSCFNGTNGSATVIANGGSPSYFYSWNTTPPQTTATATGLSAGGYTATVTDSHGCVDAVSVTIAQPTAVTLNTSVSGFSCAGSSKNGSALANPGGGTPPYTYLWNPSSKTTQSISNISAGTYSVTVTDSKGCSLTSTATLNSSNKPDAKFSYIPSVSCDGVVMNFKDESTPSSITTWLWSFGDGGSSSLQNPSHLYPYGSGYHNVSLIVYQSPCYDTLKTSIKAADLYDYATFDDKTNIFTPNSDGYNDCFIPSLGGNGAQTLKQCISLEIFDRWGVKMFTSTGTDNCWNGNNKQNNKPAVDGMYFYVAKLANKTIKGSLTLVRNKPK
ncbi:MAG TPA: gliding motility-associated C-terminal domain-containing protein [Bacteroidia bacterium]|nr:gliding motility-associated C-terminal domain-containing protein [Bacteroidia bacterium]